MYSCVLLSHPSMELKIPRTTSPCRFESDLRHQEIIRRFGSNRIFGRDRRTRSPLEMISGHADETFVSAFRLRFGQPRSGLASTKL